MLCFKLVEGVYATYTRKIFLGGNNATSVVARRSAVMRFIRSTKLLYAGPG